jgi:cell wall-associated NlpC family hydrolase
VRRIAIVCLFSAFAGAALFATPAVAAPSLEQQLDNAGTHLSEVTERYNDARLRRASLDGKLARAQDSLERSEARLAQERKKLGVAVRDLYMHPAAGIAQFFQARSFSELERKQALGGHVALSADGLILKIRKAQAEARAATNSLRRLRDTARRDELAIAREQRAAAAAHARTRDLLRRANLGALEAARQRRLNSASQLASSLVTFPGPVRASAASAVRAAASQIGKPYRWGAEGPDSYDCSGLTMWAWAHAGVSLPHSSRAQYASLPKVSMSQLAPGDLVFRGNPIHHVGIYKGGGVVIAAPQTGEHVREDSVGGYTMAARP